MALSNGAGAEVQTISNQVIGGLLSATFLTLFLVPLLYIHRQTWINKRNLRKGTLLLLLVLPVMQANAQQQISIQAALDSAMKNPSVTAKALRVDYFKKMKQSSWEPGATTVSGEFGQVNSLNNDQKYIISQEFQLPFTYIRKSQLGKDGISLAQWQLKEEEQRMTANLWMLYNDIYTAEQQVRLLKTADSIFSTYGDRSALLLAKGSSTGSDKAYADLIQGEWKMAYQHQLSALKKLNEQLNILLHTTTPVTADLSDFNPEATWPASPDQTLLQQHPSLQAMKQEEKLAHSKTLLEKSQAWPGISIGYFNQSIKGWQRSGDTEVFFDGNDRFDGIQLGLSIPLFWNFRTSKVNAGKIEEAIAIQHTRSAEEELRMQYSNTLSELNTYHESLTWYKEKGLNGALTISTDAGKRLESGDIDYMQWVLFMNKSIDIQKQYYETERLYRNALIRIHTLTGNSK